MSGRDIDSSSDEEGNYTTTNVTLGYAAKEPSGDEISHLGGHPVGHHHQHGDDPELILTPKDKPLKYLTTVFCHTLYC